METSVTLKSTMETNGAVTRAALDAFIRPGMTPAAVTIEPGRAYVCKLTAAELADMLNQGRDAEKEPGGHGMDGYIVMAAFLLCDENNQRLFPQVDQAARDTVGRLSWDDLKAVVDAGQELNGLGKPTDDQTAVPARL